MRHRVMLVLVICAMLYGCGETLQTTTTTSPEVTQAAGAGTAHTTFTAEAPTGEEISAPASEASAVESPGKAVAEPTEPGPAAVVLRDLVLGYDDLPSGFGLAEVYEGKDAFLGKYRGLEGAEREGILDACAVIYEKAGPGRHPHSIMNQLIVYQNAKSAGEAFAQFRSRADRIGGIEDLRDLGEEGYRSESTASGEGSQTVSARVGNAVCRVQVWSTEQEFRDLAVELVRIVLGRLP